MWKKITEFFRKAWNWIEALWEKHDEVLEEMVSAVLPMVIDVAFRNDLSGEEKKKAIIDAIVDGAEDAAAEIGTSMLNEAVEIAANRYNIQIGKLTVEKMDAAKDAALKASRDYANKKLKITGTEAEEAGVSLSNEDVE
jgi:hypothetical protein